MVVKEMRLISIHEFAAPLASEKFTHINLARRRVIKFGWLPAKWHPRQGKGRQLNLILFQDIALAMMHVESKYTEVVPFILIPHRPR